jgi:hypothetical protein
VGRSISVAINEIEQVAGASKPFLDIKIDLNSIPCSWI